MATAAADALIVEGEDVSNAYLHGKIDMLVITEQLENSSRKEETLGYVCKLEMYMYGLKKAGKI